MNAPITIEKIACPLCNRQETSLWKTRGGAPLFRCSYCGFIFISKTPHSTNQESQYYDDQTSTSEYFDMMREIDIINFERILRVIEQYMLPGRVLDIGTSVGTFLEIAKKRGWRGFGVEPNRTSVAIARKRGLEVTEGFLDNNFILQSRAQGNYFDLIHAAHVVDHVFDPVEFLKNAQSLLRPDGYLVVITCSNTDSFISRMYQIKPREHLSYFNKASMQYAFERAGLSLLHIEARSPLRNLSNIKHGTAPLGFFSRIISNIAEIRLVGFILSRTLAYFAKEEIFIIGQKRTS